MSYSLINSGTYTPTITGVANITATGAFSSNWFQVANMVTVEGKVDIDPTAIATQTSIGISLPVASNLATNQDLSGTSCSVDAVDVYAGAIYADNTNDRAELTFWTTTDAGYRTHRYHFTYIVA